METTGIVVQKVATNAYNKEQTVIQTGICVALVIAMVMAVCVMSSFAVACKGLDDFCDPEDNLHTNCCEGRTCVSGVCVEGHKFKQMFTESDADADADADADSEGEAEGEADEAEADDEGDDAAEDDATDTLAEYQAESARDN